MREIRPILEAGGLRAGRDFGLVFSPERIDPGNQVWSEEHSEGGGWLYVGVCGCGGGVLFPVY